MDIQEKIEKIEKEIRETPYHKGTERHIWRLRARLAKLRDRLASGAMKAKGGGGGGFAVAKTGDATVVLIGPPSVGKSTLLNAITDAKSKVGEYEFTTLKVIPGIMNYNGAKIQILDVPGLVGGAARGIGRGKQVLSVARVADLIVIMTDAKRIEQLEKMTSELFKAGVRLNQSPPPVSIKRTSKGNLQVVAPAKLPFSQEFIKEIAREFAYANAEIIIEDILGEERLVDALAGNRVYVPALRVINKADLFEDQAARQELASRQHALLLSVARGLNLTELKRAIWEKLAVIRVYLRNAAGAVDRENPLILPQESTVFVAAQSISTELAQGLEGAQIWGDKAKYPGQKVGTAYQLWEGAIVHFR